MGGNRQQSHQTDTHTRFMREAIRLSKRSLTKRQGGPFGAVIVKDGRIIARACNQVIQSTDPTAHAEVVAIRAACRKLQQVHLGGCVIYCSCEPCPMCLSAIYWARLAQVYYAATRQDAGRIGFQDKSLYDELRRPTARRSIPFRALLRSDAREVMQQWLQMEGHENY